MEQNQQVAVFDKNCEMDRKVLKANGDLHYI